MTGAPKMESFHATAVAIGGNGIMLVGPSGAGKSDLALRLIDRGASLVSDDAVMVDAGGVVPILHAAPNIEGMLEVRGFGIVRIPWVDAVPLRLVVDLIGIADRLPAANLSYSIAGHDIPRLNLAAFGASAPIKVEQALRSVVDAGALPVASQASECPESDRA